MPLLFMKRNNKFETGLIGLFLFVLISPVHAETESEAQDPKALFQKMTVAKLEWGYTGSLTHERGGQLFSYSVDSNGKGASAEQHLISLSGPEYRYEYLQHQTCYESATAPLNRLSELYNFYYRGPVRIAGRDGHEIFLLPLDQYRLGYSYVVDGDTGLMLRSISMLPDRTILERTQFVGLDILPAESVADKVDRVEEGTENSVEPLDRACAANPASVWSLGWAPQGFKLLKQIENENEVNMFFGDGLSTFSLFIEPVDGASFPPGTVHRGATIIALNYYSTADATYMVTFVGEVPPEVAERTLQNLERVL